MDEERLGNLRMKLVLAGVLLVVYQESLLPVVICISLAPGYFCLHKHARTGKTPVKNYQE
ncbi:putative ybl77 [Escherichia coli P0302308.4]|nr:hypothetical protein [Escherichia coli]ENA24336.1 putative ybl77 [Escherichia coli 201600.1]END30765.1 putative ybl77 [Escherichia coli P0302308.4]OSM04486.1 putative bacteriophage protein [Escherichia marmotae]HAG8788196.1 hypothetical protein [Escherichia coli]